VGRIVVADNVDACLADGAGVLADPPRIRRLWPPEPAAGASTSGKWQAAAGAVDRSEHHTTSAWGRGATRRLFTLPGSAPDVRMLATAASVRWLVAWAGGDREVGSLLLRR